MNNDGDKPDLDSREHIEQFVDRFYARIMDEPELKELFPDDESMARARQAQTNHWLETLLTGDFTAD